MLPFFYGFYASPLGSIRVKATENSIHEIVFADKSAESDLHQPVIIHECIRQLKAYMNGQLRTFDLSINPEGTPFQQTVWEQLRDLPFGTTTTYLKLAEQAGESRNTRAIAGAIARNPLAIVIPCHRVLGSNGSLTGYAWGLVRKQWLLDHEAKVSGTYLKLF